MSQTSKQSDTNQRVSTLPPKVSVILIAYNHESFIAQAVESVLAQEANFTYELVIGEDCSTDRTRAILQGYQERYPNTIRLIMRPHNIGGHANFCEALAACRGEYIALLDGDDFWTSPLKLQQQVNLLDAHPEYSLCGHNATIREEANPQKVSIRYSPDKKTVLTLADLFQVNPLVTCSLLLRSKYIKELPEWFHTLPMGDWSLQVISAQYGSIACLNENYATYRVHNGGVWTSSSFPNQVGAIMAALDCFKIHLGTEYATLIDHSRARWLRELAVAYYDAKDFENSRQTLRQYFKIAPRKAVLRDRRALRLVVAVFAPRLFNFIVKINRKRVLARPPSVS